MVGGTHYYIQSIIWNNLIDKTDDKLEDELNKKKKLLTINEINENSNVVLNCLDF